MTPFTVLAIMPAYNEENRIGRAISATIPEVEEIVVIDDGSTDNTKKEAREHDVTIISHPRNFGKGMAIQTGIKYALSTDYDLVIFIDADGQHDPYEIGKFKRYFQKHPDCDIVVASRFGTDQWQNNMPFLRKISNLLSRFGLWILYNGLTIEDPQNGFRAYRLKVLKHLEFDTTGYETETEMIIDAFLKGFEIGRVHIESIYDEKGNSSKFSLLYDTWSIPGVMVKNFFKKKPFLLRSIDRKLKLRRGQVPKNLKS